MVVKHTGYFRAFDFSESSEASIHDHMHETPPPHKKEILNYLANGLLWIGTHGLITDALTTDRRIIGAPHVLTDDIWIWPAVIAYYVDTYNVHLPTEFVQHMETNQWIIPPCDLEALEL